MTAEEIQTSIDAILAAMASGRQEIQQGDKRIRYRTNEDMALALQQFQLMLAQAQGGAAAQRTSYARFTDD